MTHAPTSPTRQPRAIALTTVLLAALAILAASGCASPDKHATFVTKTSLSVLDVDTAPAGVSIAYDRVEGFIGPRFADGTAVPVAGFFDTDGGVMSRRVRQVYVTGQAAKLATQQTPVTPGAPSAAASASSGGSVAGAVKGSATTGSAPAAGKPAGSDTPAVTETKNPVMFFGTGTTIGMRIGFAVNSPVPDSFVFGFRRKEASVIPVDKEGGVEKFPSVLATLDNSSEAPAVGAAVPAGGAASAPTLGITQYFATGQAAENLAMLPSVQRRFKEKAEDAVGAFREQEAQQGKRALETLFCLSRLPDAKLDHVWANAEALGLFTAAGISDALANIRAAAGNPALQRQRYTGNLAPLNADNRDYTQLLNLHRTFVCRRHDLP